tara:strand:+ start:1676 stop:2878 length:1203 start_codon:yes stop_codon:yes gene_type:complete
MKYKDYTTEDFIKDEYFQKWILDSDEMTNTFWSNWLLDNPDKKEILERAIKLVQLINFDSDVLTEKEFDLMWGNIIERRSNKEIGSVPQESSFKRVMASFWRVAAIFICLIATGATLHINGFFKSAKDSMDIGDPQITLELEDGTIEILKENSSKIVTDSNGKIVVNQDQNKLRYSSEAKSETLQYNELTVPLGKRFELELSDGSSVFLNSGSKLRYPVYFLKGQPRDVYLDGEAFFSVEKDTSRAFTVITNDMNTKVYGTTFNVSSYKNENNTSTVLVEGSVGVYKSNNDGSNELTMIKPGQRAVYMPNAITVDDVNVNKFIAWKNGKLLFINDSFSLVLKELERYFNVEIVNEFPELNDKKYTGSFEKESLEQILKIFQEHTNFNFFIQERKIRITEN